VAATGLGLAAPEIARHILDGVVAHYAAAADITLPERRIIVAGNIRLTAWDCEQVAVGMTGIGIGNLPGENSGNRYSGVQVNATGVRHAVFAVQVVRCIPVSRDGTRPPAPDVITDSGLRHIRDQGLLSQALVDITTDLTQADRLPVGSRVQVGAVQALGPEGGYAAAEGALTVTSGLLA
jgi:hypothetical protein